MPRRSSCFKAIGGLLSLLLTVTCMGCTPDGLNYTVGQFFDDVVLHAGMVSKKDSAETLKDWDFLKSDDYSVEDDLDYALLSEVLGALNDQEATTYFAENKSAKLISSDMTLDDEVSRDTALDLIKAAIQRRNAFADERTYAYRLKADYQNVEESLDDLLYDDENDHQIGDYLYSEKDEKFYRIIGLDEAGYHLESCTIEELFEDLEITDSFDLDFSKAQIIPYGDPVEKVLYNDRYRLLSSNGTTVFYHDGFRISYSFTNGTFRLYVSKDAGAINVYSEFTLNGLRPHFHWDYADGQIKSAYFKLDLKTTEKLGISKGKYGNFAIDFKDLDPSSFLTAVKSSLKSLKDAQDVTIPICRIKVPISGIPTFNLNLDLGVHLYASGKAEVVVSDAYCAGFEIKEGQFRLIFDQDHDIDAIINASANASLGLDCHLDIIGQKMMNVDLDAGLRAYVQSVLHLYDSEGHKEDIKLAEVYADLTEAAQANPAVDVCGDLSFHWLLDLTINSTDTLLGRYGLSHTYHLLDDGNQVFGNGTHIENGHFVPKCTRKDRLVILQSEPLKSDRIRLEKYSAVIKSGEIYTIPVTGVPEGYKLDGLQYLSSDPSIASVNKGKVQGQKGGVCRITIQTPDQKYQSEMNILVSGE